MFLLAVRSVHIVNFQSHAETEFELAGPGCLTVIVGPTDSGKSAIVRALKWVMYNQPAGTGFIRTATSSASVSVELTTGERVTRIRSASANQYRISHPSQRDGRGRGGNAGEQVFEGFGTAVPLEVARLLGVYPVQIGEFALLANLSEQLDAPFLGKGVPSTLRAKVLLRIAGSEVLDLAARLLSLDSHRALRDRERLEGELTALKEEIAEHSWVAMAAHKIRKAERLLSQIEVRMRVAAAGRTLLEELAKLPDVDLLIEKKKRIEQLLSRVETLDGRLYKLLDRLEILYGLRSELQRTGEDKKAALGELTRLKDRLREVETRFASLAAQLQICPTCGQPLRGARLESDPGPVS